MTIQDREQTFKEQVFRMIAFAYEIREEFYQYWSEPNKSNTKMKYELERTWDLNRRLKRWQLMKDQRKDFKVGNASPVVHTSVKPTPPKPVNMIQELDQFLQKYQDRPTDIPFSEFGKYYDYMKAEKLIKPFTVGEVENLKRIYNNDNLKCRCACVQITLDRYVNSGFTFGKVFEVRLKLNTCQ